MAAVTAVPGCVEELEFFCFFYVHTWVNQTKSWLLGLAATTTVNVDDAEREEPRMATMMMKNKVAIVASKPK